ncbi:MAG TPA: glycosyltransferase family A protein [Terriglobia bacterium]|nr:glycosyltransferase family A protein [Terriglobia bacterium]
MEHLRPVWFGPLPASPLVSVLVTNYNYGKYIGDAIQSVLAQTYPKFEVIVCDDGSKDNSCEVIETWCRKDPRILLIRQPNGGQGAALNTAFSAAKGDVIALLDGDDMALERRLELVIQAFQQHPGTGMVTHPLRILDAQGRPGGREPEEPLDEGWLAPALLHGPEPVFPPTSGLALRVEIAKRIFPLPPSRVARSHWDWLIREAAAFQAPVAAVNDTLGVYRLHGHSLFGHSRLVTLDQIEARLADLKEAMEGRKFYARSFLNAEPDARVCNAVVGVVFLSRAALLGERLPFRQIANYSFGKARWIWGCLFLLPPWLRKRIYLWAREGQIPLKGRKLKGQAVRVLEGLAGSLGMSWKPGRRVRQQNF